MISPLETRREGRRPERTVYGITESGREEFLSWLRELLGEPAKEYTRFAAGLSFLPALPPAEVAALLEERIQLLEKETGEMRSHMDTTMRGGVPRLFLVESEHELVLKEAELSWVRKLVREIEDGTLQGLAEWQSFHPETGPTEAERQEGGER